MPELVIPWHWPLVYDLDRRRWPTQFHGEACQMSSSRSFHPGHRQTRTALNDNYKMLCCRSRSLVNCCTAQLQEQVSRQIHNNPVSYSWPTCNNKQCHRRPTHSDAERTCRAVGPIQFTPPHQTQKDGPVCVVSGAPAWIGQLLWTCSDFKFSVGDSLELSGIQFTPPKRTRHRQDSFVVSGVAVWISFKLSHVSTFGPQLHSQF